MNYTNFTEKLEGMTKATTAASARLRRSHFAVLTIGVALVLMGPALPRGVMSFVLVVTIFCLYAMAYNFLLGFTNQCSLGHSVFFGLGAYGFLLSVLHFKADLWLGLLVALVLSFVFALSFGVLCVRLSEAYFVILTAILFGVFYMLAVDVTWLTGGSDGLSIAVPPIALGDMALSLYDPLTNYYFNLSILAIVYLALKRILDSPLGKVLIAIRENPERTTFLGYDTFRYKLTAFVLSGILAGLSGALYTIRLRYASAEFFGFTWSVLPIVWSLIGGLGSLIGPLVGVLVFTVFQYYVSAWWTYYMIIVGLLIIAILRVSPRGIVGYLESKRSERTTTKKVADI